MRSINIQLTLDGVVYGSTSHFTLTIDEMYSDAELIRKAIESLIGRMTIDGVL